MTDPSSQKNASFKINIGYSSILLIFVVLCLISFATLSLVSANADQKLTAKVLSRTAAYYEACSQAEKALADLDKTLTDIYQTAENSEEYFSSVGRTKSYAVSFSDIQVLQVTIEILYPEKENDPFYRITRWEIITTQEA